MRRSNAHCRCPKNSRTRHRSRLASDFNSFMLLHRRDWTRVRDYSLRTVALSQEEGFQMWLPLGQVFIGLCDAAGGRLESGLAAAFDAFDRFAATGTGVCQSHVHAPIGEFLIEAGRAEEAVRRLDARIEFGHSAPGARIFVRTLPSAGSRTPRSRRTRPGARGHLYCMRYRAFARRRDASATR